MGLLAYLSLGLFGCLLLGPFMGGVRAWPCSNGELVYNNMRYCYFLQGENWFDAEDLCRRLWRNITNISGSNVPDEIVRYLEQQQKSSGVKKDVWIKSVVKSTPGVLPKFCDALSKDEGFSRGSRKPCLDKLPVLCQEEFRSEAVEGSGPVE